MKEKHVSRFLLSALTVILAMGIAACGSGGRDDDQEMAAVTFEVIDGTGLYANIQLVGDMTGPDWPRFTMNDDDGDHIWTLTFGPVGKGTYEWGAVEYFEDAGLDLPLVEGDNPTFTVDGKGNVTGQTTHIIPPPAPLSSRFIVVDGTLTYNRVQITGTMIMPTWVSVTFMVDMNGEPISAGGVHLIGSFQDWDPLTTEMIDGDGDGIYSVTLQLQARSLVLYQFVNGDDLADVEDVPSECGVSDGEGGYYRVATVPESGGTIGFVFETCDPVELLTCLDGDVDGYGDPGDPTCPSGPERDCDDTDADVNPGMDEDCDNGIDDDCDGLADGDDPDCVPVTTTTTSTTTTSSTTSTTLPPCWDDDGDGYDDVDCGGDDCDDTDPDVNPGVVESLGAGNCGDGIDNDCDGDIDVEDDDCTVGDVDVTFNVDMSGEAVSPNGVHIAGSFQGWDPAATELTDPKADGIYSVTVQIPEGTVAQFKLINGDTWDGAETVPEECGIGDGYGGFNRAVAVPGESATFDYIFGDCLLGDMVDVTFLAGMSGEVVSPSGVHIAGSFQGWDPAATELTDPDADGVYSVTAQIPEGTVVLYKYINGSDWGGVETVPSDCGVDDGQGGYNRVIIVPAGGAAIGYGFGACDPTSRMAIRSALQEEPDWPTMDMSQEGHPHIWTVTLRHLPAGDHEWAALDGLGSSLLEEGEPNLECSVSYTGQVTGERILVLSSPTAAVDVTFEVDMAGESVSAAGVHVAGSFQSWDPAATEMTDDDGDDVYSVTVKISAGRTIQYMYINGDDMSGAETVPSSCGVDDGGGTYQREATISASGDTLGYIFGTCDPIGGGPQPTGVTFKVDLSAEQVSSMGVFVAGDFQGWDPTATELTDGGGSVFEINLDIAAGTEILFKFLNGAEWETVPEECGLDDGYGGYNRLETIPSGGTIGYVWGTCDKVN